MSFRGFGGYRPVSFAPRRRRRVMAGDMGDFGEDYGGSDDWSDVGSFDPGVAADPTDESAGLDMSPVTDPVAAAGIPDLGGGVSLAGLGGLGTALAPFTGGIGSAITSFLGSGTGSAAAAGMGALANPKTRAAVKRALKYGIGGLLRGRRSGRRMNPGNFRALHRSMRRLQAFQRAANRVYKFTRPHPHKSGFKFPRRRRKR